MVGGTGDANVCSGLREWAKGRCGMQQFQSFGVEGGDRRADRNFRHFNFRKQLLDFVIRTQDYVCLKA